MALLLAGDRDHDRIEMPLVAELRRAPTDLAGAGPGECLRTAPHGFIVDDDPARRQQVLDHPQAEWTTDKEPYGLLDDVRQEPVAAINGFRTRHHRARRADVRRHFVNLTGQSPDRPSRTHEKNNPASGRLLHRPTAPHWRRSTRRFCYRLQQHAA
jgi:hypothetical protein